MFWIRLAELIWLDFEWNWFDGNVQKYKNIEIIGLLLYLR